MSNPIGYYQTRMRTQPDWIIPGWLKRNNTGFLIGQPKRACKSWLLFNLAWDLSEGLPLWQIVHSKNGPVFEPPKAMRVVYFAQEDAEDDIHDRADLFLKAGRKPNDNFWLCPKDLKFRLDDDTGRLLIQKELDDIVKRCGPVDLILFDPMRRLHYSDENDSSVMAKLWQTLDVIHQRYNCASIFSHHIVKPPTAKGNTFDLTSPYAARGSGDIFGGGDAFINVLPVNTHGRSPLHRKLHLHFETKRGKPLSTVEVDLNLNTGGVVFQQFL